jgi:FkbM family methyltransferase
MIWRRYLNYLLSIRTIIAGFANWPLVLMSLAGISGRSSFTVNLRSGLRLRARSGMDAWIIKESCLDREYERLATPIQDGWTVVDVGAGLGDFALNVARGRPGLRVFAFEPFPGSYTLLQENLALNHLTNVKAFPYALAGSAGTASLQLAGDEPVRFGTVLGGNASQLEVRSLTLDEAFAQCGLERCDLLKMDCEGAEYEIFFGASAETLAKIREICLEYHEGVTAYSGPDLARFLTERGFAVDIHPSRLRRELGHLHALNRRLPGD